MDVSVIIPTHNKAAYLELTLASLQYQSCNPSCYEVIVVDDGSSDRTGNVIEYFTKQNQRFRSITQQNTGRGAARNAGIRAACGDILIFVDDDCICDRNLVAAHLKCYATERKKVVIAGCTQMLSRIPLHQEPLISAIKDMLHEISGAVTTQAIENIVANLPETLDLISIEDIATNPQKIKRLSMQETQEHMISARLKSIAELQCPCPWDAFITHNVSVDRETVIQVGLFDEGFRGWGEEDTELGYRLFRAGVKFDATLDAIVYHQVHPRNKIANIQEWLRNYMRFAEKYEAPEIYIRWQLATKDLDMHQYDNTVKQMLSSPLSEAEKALIKEDYMRFLADNLV